MNLTRVVISLGLLSLCVFFRQTLEADPVTHVLVQLPLLAISGGLFVSGLFVSTLGAGDLHHGAFGQCIVASCRGRHSILDVAALHRRRTGGPSGRDRQVRLDTRSSWRIICLRLGKITPLPARFPKG